MIKLRCVGKYTNDVRGWRYAVGDVFEADPEQAKFLMADAPGCFVEQAKAMETPPADKAIKTAPNKGL